MGSNNIAPSVILRIILLSFLMFVSSMASADRNNFEDGNTSNQFENRESLRGVDFNWEARMHVSTLVGEPIVHTRFRWRVFPSQSTVEIPSFRGAEDPYTTIDLPSLGSEAAQKIALIQVKVAFLFEGDRGFNRYGIVSDVGVVESPDGETWSFNIPSSPDWSNLIFRFDPGDILKGRDVSDFDLLSEQEAKNLYIDGLVFSQAVIWDAEMSFYYLHNWYTQYSSAPEVVATQNAYNRAERSVYRNFGYASPPEKSIQEDWITKAWFADSDFHTQFRRQGRDGLQVAAESIYLDSLTQKYERLSSLPREFTRNGDIVAYRREMALIGEEMARDIKRAREWTTSEKNPDDYPRGVEVEAVYETVENIILFDDSMFGVGEYGPLRMDKVLNYWKFLYPEMRFSLKILDTRYYEYSACTGKYCANTFTTSKLTAECREGCPSEMLVSPRRPTREEQDSEEFENIVYGYPLQICIDRSYYSARNKFCPRTIEELNNFMNNLDIRGYEIKLRTGERWFRKSE